MHLDSGQMARSGKRTIVHCPRGISSRFEALGGFTAVFPQWTLAAYRLRSPTLGKDKYIERAMELKLKGIALNHSRNHIEDK